jgi:hydrogenase nickel incorporation protein HypA/HybF
MHEVALCNSLVDLIRDQQHQRGFQRVRRVIVEVGVLGHVDPHALDFAFEVEARNSPAEGAVLEIREIEGRAWCMDCSKLQSLGRRGDACPDCGGFTLIVEQGEELRLKELEVI